LTTVLRQSTRPPLGGVLVEWRSRTGIGSQQG
jgi:hypothetical protein